MRIHHLASLLGHRSSDIITEVLGVVALCSFLAIAVYIGLIMVRDSGRKRALARAALLDLDLERRGRAVGRVERSGPSEKEKMEAQYLELFNALTQSASAKLDELAALASDSFAKVAEGYSMNSYGHEGETSKVRSRRFSAVCERQWSFFRGDIGYLSFAEIQENLRSILDNHRLLNARHSDPDVASVEMTPELLRSQEIVSLLRVVPKDKIKHIQSRMIEVVERFRTRYEAETKIWLDDQLVRITKELRKRDSKTVSLSETGCAERFKQLKARLDVVARICDSISQNTQRIGEEGLAFSQAIYVGTVLNIVASLPEWFSELELETAPEEEQAEAAVSA